jgi:hypothetical protein
LKFLLSWNISVLGSATSIEARRLCKFSSNKYPSSDSFVFSLEADDLFHGLDFLRFALPEHTFETLFFRSMGLLTGVMCLEESL